MRTIVRWHRIKVASGLGREVGERATYIQTDRLNTHTQRERESERKSNSSGRVKSDEQYRVDKDD